MRTIKLVVIGASGVGKTSLRGQYISGRFSTGYRATIGADFISKTLSLSSNPDESVTLQIWDTAGQERFSSLSSAFFRGADAAILMFDVNSPATMEALTKWWAEFKERAPLADEDTEDYCCVVVGNKVDLSEGSSGNGRVTEAAARVFLDTLVPRRDGEESPISPNGEDSSHNDSDSDDPLSSSQLTERPRPSINTQIALSISRQPPSALPPPSSPPRSSFISINPNTSQSLSPSNSGTPFHKKPKDSLSKSRSRSSSRFHPAGNGHAYGTMTTTHTALSIYHTPSSSVYDIYASARTSPEPSTSSSSSPSPRGGGERVPKRMKSAASTSTTNTDETSESSSSRSTSAVTITPSLFARSAASRTPATSTSTTPVKPPPSPPLRGPKLFFTSAKTGVGVNDVFEYVARRVVRRWEWEEGVEARRMSMRESEDASDVVRLGLESRRRQQTTMRDRCCA